MSAEQKEQIEKQMKERAEAMKKNKALNDAFNVGMEALKTNFLFRRYFKKMERERAKIEKDPALPGNGQTENLKAKKE